MDSNTGVDHWGQSKNAKLEMSRSKVPYTISTPTPFIRQGAGPAFSRTSAGTIRQSSDLQSSEDAIIRKNGADFVNPTTISLTVFACTFGGALLGLWLHSVLPQHHINDASKDTIKVGIALIATMTALVLGLVTASAKNSFDSVEAGVQQTAIDALTLDRSLAQYGTETKMIRTGLLLALAARLDMIWPQDSSSRANLDPMQSGGAVRAEGLMRAIRNLQPGNDTQRALQSEAVNQAETLLKARWLLLASMSSSIPVYFLIILVFWLTITFTSFGLFAPKNATVVTVLFVCALSVSSAIFLVLEMDGPFEGLLRASPEPLRLALAHLNQ